MYMINMTIIYIYINKRGFIIKSFCRVIDRLLISQHLKLRAMNESALFSVLQLFSVCFCQLRALVMMIPRSTVDLLLATVEWTCYSCFARCCVWCASQNITYIETHLLLVGPLNKFIGIFLKFHYVIRVSSSMAKFSIICKFRHFADNINI